MSDRELLEQAAKAAGIHIEWAQPLEAMVAYNASTGGRWNPLTDDGDALRLAMKLGLVINCRHSQALAETSDAKFWESHDNGEDAATRRAIVRAAAALAKAG